jgi:PAS domain S-box-containing protein
MTFTPEDRAHGVPEKERQEARDMDQAPNVRWHLRKDGSRVFIDGVARPLTAPDGRLEGFVKVGQDVTERRATAVALRESEERLRQFGDASGDVRWIRNADTLDWEYVSLAFENVYGVRRDSILGRNHVRRWLEMIVPDDHALALGHLRRVRKGEHVLSAFRILRGDGEVRWIRDTGFPILDGDGRVRRVAGISHDATEEVELHDRLRVLVAELQHRSRNLVTVVRGVTERTLATSGTLDDFRARFRPRLEAMGRVNSLLSRLEEGHRITFDQLLRAELSAHGVREGENPNSQVRLSGPSGVPLRSATVQTFALALHELTPNALKPGARSRPEGRLEVSWTQVRGHGDERRLRVEWRESGVAVAPPDGQPEVSEADGRSVFSPQGYGRELIERALPYQLRAQTSYELTPEGVRCTIVMPVSSTLDVAFSSYGDAET